MASSSKITNNMFVWGSNSQVKDQLADLTRDETTKVVQGYEGGDLLEADKMNSMGRPGSLFAYTFIEALKSGPTANSAWDTNLTSVVFDYKVNDNEISNFIDNFKTILDAYLAGSQAYSIPVSNANTSQKYYLIGVGENTTSLYYKNSKIYAQNGSLYLDMLRIRNPANSDYATILYTSGSVFQAGSYLNFVSNIYSMQLGQFGFTIDDDEQRTNYLNIWSDNEEDTNIGYFVQTSGTKDLYFKNNPINSSISSNLLVHGNFVGDFVGSLDGTAKRASTIVTSEVSEEISTDTLTFSQNFTQAKILMFELISNTSGYPNLNFGSWVVTQAGSNYPTILTSCSDNSIYQLKVFINVGGSNSGTLSCKLFYKTFDNISSSWRDGYNMGDFPSGLPTLKITRIDK